MSVARGLHRTIDDDDSTSTDLMTFCMQVVDHSQWKSRRTFICGSFVDIPFSINICKNCVINQDKLDIDRMVYDSSRFAFNRSVTVPESYNGRILRIYTNDVHTGYARLVNEIDNTEARLSDIHTEIDGKSLHGPAVLIDNEKNVLDNKFSLSEAAVDKARAQRITIKFFDEVFAFHSPYWPLEATEWITRKRPHFSLSKSVIKQIVSYGCDFAKVSHNRLSSDNEWRFSFSRAERFIVESWTKSQRVIYSTLWVINKMITSSKLCSYYFKTLMFWAREEKPIEFWLDDSRQILLFRDKILHCVCELLIHMMAWVKIKLCVNYFIPGNNMMDHLIDMDLSSEIDAIFGMCQSTEIIPKASLSCVSWDCEIVQGFLVRRIESLSWIKRAHVIYSRVQNEDDNLRNLFCPDLDTLLKKSVYEELSDIYKALCFQQKSVRCVSVSDKHALFLKSEKHLLLALNLCESNKREVTDNCSDKLLNLFIDSCIRETESSSEVCRPKDNVKLNTRPKRRSKNQTQNQNSFKGSTEKKRLLYSRSEEKHENTLNSPCVSEKVFEGRNEKVVEYIATPLHTSVQSYKPWPGRSPTVNISWFIAKAYLANLYYTSKYDVSLTTKTCDDIIDVYKQSYTNQQFAEKTLPVVLSTQWTSIYDKEIQALLGFHSLCSYVLYQSSSRSVYLDVCPVHFALYIRLRNSMDAFQSIYKFCDLINKHFCEFRDHLQACQCYERVNDDSDTLQTSIRLFRSQHYKRWMDYIKKVLSLY